MVIVDGVQKVHPGQVVSPSPATPTTAPGVAHQSGQSAEASPATRKSLTAQE